MSARIDRDRLSQAFELLGRDLAEHGTFVELAVYGGSAIMLQFEWRLATEDVDAIVRAGCDERTLTAAATRVGVQLGLAPEWLNNAVGMFTPLDEQDSLFDFSGSYPAGGDPGLRVLVAKPHYLLGMKLRALRAIDRGDRDVGDARRLAEHLGFDDPSDLDRLYREIHGEPPPAEIRLRFEDVLRR